MPSVAVLGASAHRAKFGNKAVRAFVRAGWRVFPVHPREPSIEGLPAVASLANLPERVDVLSVYLPPAITKSLVREIAAAQPHAIWLNPGAESPDLLRALRPTALPITCHCSITALGATHEEFPD